MYDITTDTEDASLTEGKLPFYKERRFPAALQRAYLTGNRAAPLQ